MKRLELRALLAAALLLVAGGTIAAYQEFTVFAQGGTSAESRFEALRDGQIRLGLSSLSGRTVLGTCGEALLGSAGFARPLEEQQAVQRHCRTLAEAEAARQPGAAAQGHFVAALSASSFGELGEFSTHMALSQATAPQSAWLALQRVPFSEVWLDRMTPDQAVRHGEDLQLMVQSAGGIDYVAGLFVGKPGFEARIVPLVDALDEVDQARFVSAVRRAAEAARQ